MTAAALRARVAAAVLPPTSGGRRLMVAFLTDTFGTGLFLAGSTVFFTRHIGLSAAQVGIGLSAASLVGFLATVPAGVLADRYGVRKVQFCLHLWRGTGFVLYVFCHDFASFLAISCMIGVGDRASPPLNQALCSLAVPKEVRVRTMGLLRAAKNLSFTLGGLVAVLALSAATPTAYLSLVLVNAVSFALVAAIVIRMPLLRDDHHVDQRRRFSVSALRDRRYLSLGALNGVLNLHSSLLMAGIPLYVLTQTDAPAAVVSALFVVNTAVATTLQVTFSRNVTTVADGGRAEVRAAAALVATCALGAMAAYLPMGPAVAVLVGAVLMLTVGEMTQAAGGWAISFELAPREREAEYLSVFNLGVAAEGIVGPMLVTLLVVHGSLAGWAVLAAVFVVAGVATAALTRTAAPTAQATRPAPPAVVSPAGEPPQPIGV